jgi:pimeloyl-ACP methyl ester carboxylesterase
MATFVLIHGAGDSGWYWHLAEAELQARGHHTIAPDLPCGNDTASLDDYAGTVIDAATGRPDLVLVSQSYGAFTATLAASRLPARLLVLLAGMIPAAGETPGQWWVNTGYQQAAGQQARLDGGKTGHDDPLISYYNGVPRPLAEQALRRGGRGESTTVWNTPWPLDTWPDVPTRFIACRDDRFFPAAFLRRVARERLGIDVDEIPGCHCAALSHPRELSDRLVSYLQPPRSGLPAQLTADLGVLHLSTWATCRCWCRFTRDCDLPGLGRTAEPHCTAQAGGDRWYRCRAPARPAGGSAPAPRSSRRR